MYDAIVIGGGFYGATIAVYLTRERGFSKVGLVERESDLLTRASYNNQARVHNGYHYPRSFTTAFRSRVNLPRFVADYAPAINRNFTNIYAVARRNSKITAKQFGRFCREIGARLEVAPPSLLKLFEPRLIERAYLVEEYAFDAKQLASYAKQALNESKVDIHLNTQVQCIRTRANGLSVECDGSIAGMELLARFVFNCTYSGLNQFAGDFTATTTKLKHEIAELALVQLPPALRGMGVTVMDGPFFSLMPFPARTLHTLSHVRYTPHLQWNDVTGLDPYQKLARYNRATRADRMVRDAARYMPGILDAQYVDSLFEVKTILVKSEGDDSRPILFEQHPELPGCYSILGGKIDNIYDVIEKLDDIPFSFQ